MHVMRVMICCRVCCARAGRINKVCEVLLARKSRCREVQARVASKHGLGEQSGTGWNCMRLQMFQ